MAKLSSQHKRLIVQRLACFHTPSEVRAELQEVYGLDVPLSTVMRYDPTTAQGGQELAKDLQALFHETRSRFAEDTTAIAMAHRSFRLRELLNLYRGTKNPGLKKELLREAREEMKGLDITAHLNLDELSDEELERLANGEDPLRIAAASRKGRA
ncbi:MAG TPA: DUF2280 domain-containing protein [Armatimonadota bacterium]|nr:DUF2280 domain-containing protein [Armatimonadota bacterium]